MAESCGTDVLGYVTEDPGLRAHALSNGTVHRTYVTTARGPEPARAYYGLLDRLPMGRNEEGEETHWLRCHDEYGKPEDSTDSDRSRVVMADPLACRGRSAGPSADRPS
ncbi:DUF899 family protein [Kitasatospora sp. HPMI-4]|uniref:DUF899 family protein n=1 Tax=Kitasatospora sp. HPMI-4 TaxID=3448443 RepID=UPI003F1D1869